MDMFFFLCAVDAHNDGEDTRAIEREALMNCEQWRIIIISDEKNGGLARC